MFQSVICFLAQVTATNSRSFYQGEMPDSLPVVTFKNVCPGYSVV